MYTHDICRIIFSIHYVINLREHVLNTFIFYNYVSHIVCLVKMISK